MVCPNFQVLTQILYLYTQQEKEKMMVSEMIGKVTSECWDKCITGAPGSKLSSGETSCLSNCAQRFIDMSEMIAKRFGAH
ncbi:unnamed protein product [Triticum turgidum subsp. durum]|uniref:Mitochondrial import inner membrane translocase subunit n=1 Tax=Triticum turgidum subsp. durum TaxID=4567 RepID=A0A9R0WPW8_TRITD|nr:unnamed protein product [Triticum turgidum subsp. durum]